MFAFAKTMVQFIVFVVVAYIVHTVLYADAVIALINILSWGWYTAVGIRQHKNLYPWELEHLKLG